MDDVKLPESAEEYQRALREAFCGGARFERGPKGAWVSLRADKEAQRHFPIRKKVPRVVTRGSLRYSTDSNGTGERFVAVTPVRSGDLNDEVWLYADDIDVMRDLLANPYTVEES